MSLISEHKTQIEALCRQYGVRRLYVFGSVLSDRFSGDSDIDLVVEFAGIDLAHYADNYYALKFALEKELGRSIDLLEEQAIRNPYFKQSLEAQRQLLYAA